MSKFICAFCKNLREEYDDYYELCEKCFFEHYRSIKKFENCHVVTFENGMTQTYYKHKCMVCKIPYIPKRILSHFRYSNHTPMCDKCACS